LSLPGVASAQRPRAIEIGGFGRYTIFPDTLRLENVFAGGGRLGYFILPNLSLEGDVSFGVSDRVNEPIDSLRDVSHTLWQARLLFNTPPRGRTSFLVGAGYTYDGFGRLRRGPARGQGGHGLLGARFYLTNRVTLRAGGDRRLHRRGRGCAARPAGRARSSRACRWA
jgi:hypothetical protein